MTSSPDVVSSHTSTSLPTIYTANGSPMHVSHLGNVSCWTGSEYIHKFITQLPKDYYLIPVNGAIKLVGPDQSIYTSL